MRGQIAQQVASASLPHNLFDRTSQIDVHDIRAHCFDHGRGFRHAGAVGTEDLNGNRALCFFETGEMVGSCA